MATTPPPSPSHQGPAMATAPQRVLPQRVATLEHLRHLIDEQPGKQLFVEIGPNLSFEDVRMMWEAASLKGGHAEVFNPEMLRSKMQACDFVGARINELEAWRDLLNGHIGCMRNWCLLMKKDLDNRGPYIPESHCPIVMFGPTLYLDLDQIGTVNDVDQHRQDILREYFDMQPEPGSKRKRSDSLSDGDGASDFSGSPVRGNPEYFSLKEARKREKEDRHSLIRINMDFLQIKIEGLLLLRDRIVRGIKAMKHLSKERMYIGCGNGDFGSFRNIVMGPTAMDVD